MAASRIQKALEAVSKLHEQAARDKRTLQGAHAPPTGVCRVCGGKVVPEIKQPVSDRIGGPAPQSYVAYWHCEECGLMYRTPPKKTSGAGAATQAEGSVLADSCPGEPVP